MAKVSQGFKLAIVKFIGETEFAPGEWIGVAFKHPIGRLAINLVIFNLLLWSD